ncbi:MAG: hypothetical protein ACP5VQ_04535 [Phycisphaerae bacterium]
MSIESIITVVGIPAIVAALIYIGRKLEVLDALKLKLDAVEKKVDGIFERFIKVEERVNTLWKDDVAPSHSPRQLNERGLNILNQSGIKQIIEARKQTLLNAVKALNPTNAYDAEQAALDVVSDLPKHCPDVIPQLKDGAFKAGQGIETVLLVGGFYLRDLIFPELGFSTTDLDKPKTA